MVMQHEGESGSGLHGEGAVSDGEEGSCLLFDEEFLGTCHPTELASVSESCGLHEGTQDEPEPKKEVADIDRGKLSPHWPQEVLWA